jgi:thiamine-monophosphate kinase
VTKSKYIVSDIGEKRLIREIIAPLSRTELVEVGVGDDAAVVAFPPSKDLVISSDKIPEDLLAIQLGLMDAFHHGRYLATVNISDIAAMGADPLGLLCTLALPNEFSVQYLESFMRGFVAGGAEWKTPVVGGDTGWGSAVCLSATAFGAVTPGSALLRTRAQIGDKLFASGCVGGFGTALAYFIVARERGLQLSAQEELWLRDRLIRPVARVEIGRSLSASMACTSCIDVTDGVGQSLLEIAEASGVRLRVEVRSLPIHPLTAKVANFLNCTIEKIVLGIGLDLELLGTVRSGAMHLLPQELRFFGDVVEGSAGVVLDYDGQQTGLPIKGWQHFTGSAMDLVRETYK